MRCLMCWRGHCRATRILSHKQPQQLRQLRHPLPPLLPALPCPHLLEPRKATASSRTRGHLLPLGRWEVLLLLPAVMLAGLWLVLVLVRMAVVLGWLLLTQPRCLPLCARTVPPSWTKWETRCSGQHQAHPQVGNMLWQGVVC